MRHEIDGGRAWVGDGGGQGESAGGLVEDAVSIIYSYI